MEIGPTRKTALYALFALSGFCALIYEILWTKYLSLTFGATIIAVSIVAATFMGGLALGSFLLGRFADHETNLLRIYAYLELGIALTALLFPPTLSMVEKLYVWMNGACPDCLISANLFHFIFSATLLLPPAICMGGTFPLMCRFFARKKSGGQIGRLYALNTLGATAGTFLAGFALIPSLGLSATGYLAITGNLVVAACAFLLSNSIGATAAKDVSKATRPDEPLHAREHRLALVAIGLVGACSLGYEILWTRVLLLFLGNTTYAFSLMLSAYLVGIALGGGIYARKVRPELDEKKVFTTLTALMGISVLITAPFYDQLAHVFQYAHEASGERWWHLSMLSFFIVFAVMSLPTIISGSLLPAAVAILDPGKKHTGEGVGLVVLYNTVGAVLGSLLTGFALLPIFGLLGSFRFLAALNVGLAMYLFFRYQNSTGRMRAGLSLGMIALISLTWPFSWNQQLMNSGVYIYAPKYSQMGGIDKVLADEKVIKVYEGRDATVAVHESNDGSNRFFTVNGKTDGGTGRDMATQLLVGHLPLLLHPSPREVLVIGLGTGITLRGLAEHPTDRIDCVEISPEVVAAAAYFEETNGSALHHPKVKLFVNDGRNLLLTSPQQYDVIVSEPSNPWQTGNANLFTADFYHLATQRLKPNGLFCQWIGLYDITPENLRTLFNTFLKEFPKTMLFKAGTDLILVGAHHELSFDYRDLRQRLAIPGVRDALQEVGIGTPGDLVALHYLFSEGPLVPLTEKAQLNTDDRPILEYAARYNLGEHTLGEFQMQNMRMLLDAQSAGKIYLPLVNLGASPAEVATALRELGQGYARAGRSGDAENLMRRAAEIEAQATGLPGSRVRPIGG